jgi:hypothetical protein
MCRSEPPSKTPIKSKVSKGLKHFYFKVIAAFAGQLKDALGDGLKHRLLTFRTSSNWNWQVNQRFHPTQHNPSNSSSESLRNHKPQR